MLIIFHATFAPYQGQEKEGDADEQQNSNQEKVQEVLRQESTQEPTQEPTQESKEESKQETRQETRKDKTNAADQGANEELTQKEASRDDGARLQAVGGSGGDLGLVEPDDDPLSCLADEEGGTGGGGGGRPPMRLLVAPVDSKLAVSFRCKTWLCLIFDRDEYVYFSGGSGRPQAVL